MVSLLSQFGLNILIVAVLLALHVITARIVIQWRARGRAISTRKWWVGAVVLIVFLDVPLVYLQLIYKSWHPLFVDKALYAIRYPWTLMQINALVLGSLLIGYRYVIQPVLRLTREFQGSMESNLTAARSTTMKMSKPVPMTTNAPMNTMHKNSMDNNPEKNAKESSGFSRRSFLQTSGLAVGGIILNGSLLVAANDDDERVIERVSLRVPGLPEALSGTTIAMMSDIHSSVFMNRTRMERYARILNSLHADVIVLPGDFVNSKVREVLPFGEAFSSLQAPLGVYGVTGNHDYYTGQIETIAKEIEDAGIKLLRNENIQLEKNGATFRLMGMDDEAIYDVRGYLKNGKTEQGRIENLVQGVGDKEPTILLCHKPYPFEEYASLGVDLMLSGHTHGGQIVLGRLDRLNVSVASLASTYIAGLYKARSNPDAQMYISRGIGTAGIPIRINCPPEITHITLV